MYSFIRKSPKITDILGGAFKAYDVPPNLLKSIMLMYKNTRAKVISPDGETDYFKILTGVLQGDTLAPYLFVIVLDFVLRKTFEGREEELGVDVLVSCPCNPWCLARRKLRPASHFCPSLRGSFLSVPVQAGTLAESKCSKLVRSH